ncbi:MAG TPA: hypothetical protein VJP07_03855 [Dehalococcoidia bacterium]|nr:hypothetical protein [Dehalococcoidia bacterium]
MVTTRKPAHRPKKAAAKRTAKKPFDAFAYLIELGKRIPEEELARLPRDLAENFDHYHDGAPKQKRS